MNKFKEMMATLFAVLGIICNSRYCWCRRNRSIHSCLYIICNGYQVLMFLINNMSGEIIMITPQEYNKVERTRTNT